MFLYDKVYLFLLDEQFLFLLIDFAGDKYFAI